MTNNTEEARHAEAEPVVAIASDADNLEAWLSDAPSCKSMEGANALLKIDQYVGDLIDRLRGPQ